VKVRQLTDRPLAERAEYLLTLSAELKLHLKGLTGDGLAEHWLRIARDLADELAVTPADAAATQHLWMRTVDVFDALAGDEQPEIPTPVTEQAAQQARRGTAFWKRG
jgi:hypothetical protein